MIEEEEAAAPEPIAPDAFVAFVTGSDNLAAELGEAKRAQIAATVIEEYRLDKSSMSEWFDRMKRGLDLARLVKDKKDYPFDGASNVKYPLITSAALQFNARAYPAIVPPDRAVTSKVYGADPMGLKSARGERTSSFMSYQLACEITEWEDDTDKLLVQLPIVGTMYRKVWFDPVEGRARCRLIDAGSLVVNDKVKDLAAAPRVTEEIPLFPVEIESRVRAGTFLPVDVDKEDTARQTAQTFIEQHTRIDLDDDGYPEPYIVTVHLQSEQVARIVADFDPDDVVYRQEQRMGAAGIEAVPTGVISVRRNSYFVPYHFLPSLDGGFHGTGLGLLLGDISDAINSIINMMLDAGHYASLGGGFVGGEFRVKGGALRMRPGEWRMFPSKGADIRSGMVEVTYPGPDATLFEMLGLLIEAGREIASVKDVMTGDAQRAQQTATTTLALIEQGMMVFTAAYKRIYRSLRAEFKLLAAINARHLSPERYNAFLDDEDVHDPARDFGAADMDIVPVADPRSVTRMQEMAKADLVMQMAGQGLADPQAASVRILEAAGIPDIEDLAPRPDPMQQALAQMQVQMAQAGLAKVSAEIELLLAQVEETRAAAVENMTSANTDEMRVRLDALKTMLEDERGRIAESVKLGLGAMARKPSDGDAARGSGANNGAGEGRGAGGVLVWPSMAGGRPLGAQAAGDVAGGPVQVFGG